MTPRACSLYDEIMLKNLKRGYVELKDFSNSAGLAELIHNGYVKIRRYRVSVREPVVEYIELLR